MVTIDSGAWTTLNNVKEQVHLGISELDFDDQLSNLVNRSYKILEKYIGRPIKQATYTEFYSGDNTGELVLRKWPVISVTSVYVDTKLDRVFGSDTLVDSANYYVDVDSENSVGAIQFVQQNGTGPTFFEFGIRNIKVTYVAGFATIPNDLVHASTMHVSWMFRRSDTEGTNSQSLASKTETYDNDLIPAYIKQILYPYKDYSH